MNTGNPLNQAFNSPTWDDLAPGSAGAISSTRSNVMTVSGAVNASFILITLCAGTGLGAWYLAAQGIVPPSLLAVGGAIGGLVLGLIIYFAQRTAPFLGPVYAVCEGCFIGGVSFLTGAVLEAKKVGLGSATVGAAVGITCGVFFLILIGYKLGLLRISSIMMRAMMIGLAAVGVTWLGAIVGSFVGFPGLGNAIWGNGAIGIGFSLVCVALASFFLISDFQFIEEAGNSGQFPKHMEWYAGVALLGTLVWLYIEILRLLTKLNSRD